MLIQLTLFPDGDIPKRSVILETSNVMFLENNVNGEECCDVVNMQWEVLFTVIENIQYIGNKLQGHLV